MKKVSKRENSIYVLMDQKIYLDKVTLIHEKLLPYIDKGVRNFTFDFRDVEYIDSSCLGALVAIQKRISVIGGKVVIKGLNSKVKTLFEMTKLNQVFDIIN